MVLKHISTHHNYSIRYLNAVVLCVWSGWLGVLYPVLFILSSKIMVNLLSSFREKINYLNATHINISNATDSTSDVSDSLRTDTWHDVHHNFAFFISCSFPCLLLSSTRRFLTCFHCVNVLLCSVFLSLLCFVFPK